MQMRQAQRSASKLRIGISGLPSSGKTMSGLYLAHGLCSDWSKICVIDSERGSADLYEHLGKYNVISLSDYSPSSYIQAINTAITHGMEVIIIDSLTHAWKFCCDLQQKLGGQFKDWATAKKEFNMIINTIFQSNVHFVITMRQKIDYLLVQGEGVKKVGLKEENLPDFEYELTANFEINRENHMAKATRDRSGLFMDKEPFLINTDTGVAFKQWAEVAEDEAQILGKALVDVVNSNTIPALVSVYKSYVSLHKNKEFIQKVTEKQNLLKQTTTVETTK